MSVVSYEDDPTHTYKKVKEGSHYKCYCTNVERRADGLHKCTFCKREDHLKQSISEGKIHICKFEKLKTTNTMENYFKPQEDKSDSVISKDNIITKISILTGKQNLSLNVGSSKQMTDLIQTCIQFGMQNPKSDVKKTLQWCLC